MGIQLFDRFDLPNKLDVNSGVHLGPGIPVILVEGILDRYDWVLGNKLLVYSEQLVGGQLETQAVMKSSIYA